MVGIEYSYVCPSGFELYPHQGAGGLTVPRCRSRAPLGRSSRVPFGLLNSYTIGINTIYCLFDFITTDNIHLFNTFIAPEILTPASAPSLFIACFPVSSFSHAGRCRPELPEGCITWIHVT